MTPEQLKLIQQLAEMGDVVVINNRNRFDLNDSGDIPLKTQAEAVLYFLQHLDVTMVSNILNDKQAYQNFEKSLFIKKLSDALDEFIEAGDTYLNRYDGVCNSKTCNFNCKGFSFVGNKSEDYLDLIIDIQDGVVLDIYECFSFKCENQEIKKNEYIGLDKSDYPF